MFQSEFESFRGLMSDLCAAFDRPVTDERVRIFWDVLKKLPIEVVRSRMKFAAATCKKMPTPNELLPQETETKKSEALGPHPSLEIINWAMTNKPLTQKQRAAAWCHIVRYSDGTDVSGKTVRNHTVEFIGVIIPADGNVPGYRILKQDMLANFA